MWYNPFNVHQIYTTLWGKLMLIPERCELCPRLCRADRRSQTGRCGGGSLPRVVRAAPHHWEEPCISGTKGSGAVFFSGCHLGCAFCQNHSISHGQAGTALSVEDLAACFLKLEGRGVHNLNLVTASHYRPWVMAALQIARGHGFKLPVVWNTGGYERLDSITGLANDVDVWLFDLKFHSPALSAQLAAAPDYFRVASAALQEACRLAGPPVFSADGLLLRGVVLRLLVLPGHKNDAQQLLAWAAENLPRGGFLLSLMSQYTPPQGIQLPSPFNRRLASYEYRAVAGTALELGLQLGYFQDRASASPAYIPPFEEGIL